MESRLVRGRGREKARGRGARKQAPCARSLARHQARHRLLPRRYVGPRKRGQEQPRKARPRGQREIPGSEARGAPGQRPRRDRRDNRQIPLGVRRGRRCILHKLQRAQGPRPRRPPHTQERGDKGSRHTCRRALFVPHRHIHIQLRVHLSSQFLGPQDNAQGKDRGLRQDAPTPAGVLRQKPRRQADAQGHARRARDKRNVHFRASCS